MLRASGDSRRLALVSLVYPLAYLALSAVVTLRARAQVPFAAPVERSALTLKLREGRIQSAERAVPTHSRSNATKLLSA